MKDDFQSPKHLDDIENRLVEKTVFSRKDLYKTQPAG